MCLQVEALSKKMSINKNELQNFSSFPSSLANVDDNPDDNADAQRCITTNNSTVESLAMPHFMHNDAR